MNNGIVKQKTKEEFLTILESEQAGGSISIAAQLSGISRQTVYNWRKDDYSFDDAVIKSAHEGKISIADLAEQALVKRIKAGDTTAIIFTLKTLRRKYYGEKEEQSQPENKVNNKAVSNGVPQNPKEVVLTTKLMIEHYHFVMKKTGAFTDRLELMYQNLKWVVDHELEMLK